MLVVYLFYDHYYIIVQ